MREGIDEGTLAEADACPYGHRRRSQRWQPCGKGVGQIGHDFVEMEDPVFRACPYRVHCSRNTYCVCPVRNRFYHRTRV